MWEFVGGLKNAREVGTGEGGGLQLAK